ncbi:ABC transporter permease [Enterococcus sp. DIV0876]|uniref:ABC transporter permease n=1 Tax=Enterococcus sp. DIV0876 TaxID=2774633 RepID=UPI003D2FACE8
MFWQIYYYRLKVLMRNKSLLFWTLAFPIILGLMFVAAFGQLDQGSTLETIPAAVVFDAQEPATGENFVEVLASIETDGTAMFALEQLTADDAKNQLEADQIAGYYELQGEQIFLHVGQAGIRQTVMKSVMDQYLQQAALYKSQMDMGNLAVLETMQSLDEPLFQVRNEEAVMSIKSFYFFTLVGMSILYGTMWGLRNAQDQQANQSPNGIRLSLIPKPKSIVTLANLLASFTVLFSEVLLILGVYRFIYQVDFGTRWQWLFVIVALGTLSALLLGLLLGNAFPNMSLAQKEGILTAVTMAMSFLAGMMGSEQIKYWIDATIPIIGKINLVNLISESLYQLYYYQELSSFYLNILWLGGILMLFAGLNWLVERRVQYDAL